MNYKLNTLYFSDTDTTKKVVRGIGDGLSEAMDLKENINNIDFTLPKVMEKSVFFSKNDIVIIGFSVYAG